MDQPIVVIFSMSVEAKKGIEPSPSGCVVPVAVPEVPLAHCVGPVSPLLQNLVRHKQQLGKPSKKKTKKILTNVKIALTPSPPLILTKNHFHFYA